MSKIILGILSCIGFTLTIYSQNTPDSFSSRINYIFQHVDKNQIPTGMLTNHGIDFLNLNNYTGQQLHDSNYVGNKEWMAIYASLYSSQVRILSTLPAPDSVAARFNSNIMAISLLAEKFYGLLT